MDAIKANNLSYPFIKQNSSDEQKTSENSRQEFKKPAFAASLPVREGLGKKMLNLVDKFQRKVEKGGFFFEFIFIDFVGLIIPRTVQAYNRNKKELGHPNYKAATEEFLREILTGPSMFLIPMVFLAASKKMFGPASHVKLDTLKKFKEITGKVVGKIVTSHRKGVPLNDGSNLAKSFYNEVVEKLYGSKINENAKKIIVDDFLNLHKAAPKEVKDLSKKVTETLISTNQKVGTSLAESSKINLGGISKNVGNFVEECRNYSSDVINTLSAAGKEASGQLVNQIHDFKEGARKLIVTTAVASMGGFLYFIPKIYQQTKEYPGLDGLVGNSAPASKEKEKSEK